VRRRRASDLRSLLLRGHGAVVDEADESGEVDEECDRANAGSGSHNLDAPYLARQRCRGVGCPPRAPMGPEPLCCPIKGRRVHEEQIEASTRAVYPGSGRGGRVKPYSCLVCIGLESSGARGASYTERMSDLASEP